MPRPSHVPAVLPGSRGRFPAGARAEVRLLALALLLLVPAAPPPAHGGERGSVVEVVDGDTLRVRTGNDVRIVRLLGIDAPETGHPARPREFLGAESAAFLATLCEGKPVRMEADAEDVDSYGRLLRYVYLRAPTGGETLVNLEIVRQGLARVMRRFPFSRQAEFLLAEREAKRAGRGLFRDGGTAELRWLRESRSRAVEVHPAAAGTFSVVYAGRGKSGVSASALAREIRGILRLRAENADADFARKATEAGFLPLPPAEPLSLPAPVESRAHRTAESASAPALLPAVSWESAGDHVGGTVTVEGTVVRTYSGRDILILNFHPNWKRYLSVVIHGENLHRFPEKPEEHYRGRTIRVTGEVSTYQGRPQIVVTSPDAIFVLPEPAPAPSEGR